jgi:hypothetical protein
MVALSRHLQALYCWTIYEIAAQLVGLQQFATPDTLLPANEQAVQQLWKIREPH